ncbi:MAG TPA: ABC transporter substrate-binding protein [Gaiella sp.]|jgi:ABC-type branched-subunit amino acid transport system substrate-binding protein|nr:ABC transporter substrate-binding protein [Gaiella sp.]
MMRAVRAERRATIKEEHMNRLLRPTRLAAVVGIALAAIAATATGATSVHSASPRTCAFELRIGDVLPFTGDLAAYGANLDRAVKQAVVLQNAALKKAGLTRASVRLVGSEDGQTQASASVEAATKLIKANKATVIIGEMASGATIPMAQSVTIPNNVVLVSPTSSAPQISDLKDKGLVFRAYPSDALQSKVLAGAALTKFGKGAKLNVGARNDAFGKALQTLFVAEWKRLGGTVGTSISWNPDQANFDTDAAKLLDGDPAGWVVIDFPDTFEKFAPSLVRSGKWSASKTLGIEALRNAETLDKIGDPVKGLSGSAGSAAGGPAGKAFAAYWKKNVKGAKAYTGFEGTAFDAAMTAFLAAVRGCSASPAKIKAHMRAVSAPPGLKVTFLNLAAGVKAAAAGKDVNYEGAFSPVDFDRNGDIGSAVYEIWQYDGAGKITTLRTITFRGS